MSSKLLVWSALPLALLAVALWLFLSAGAPPEQESAHVDIDRLESALESQGRQIAGIKAQLEILSKQLQQPSSQSAKAPIQSSNLDEIVARLDELERQSDYLMHNVGVGASESVTLQGQSLSERGSQPLQQSAYTLNPSAETLFEEDAGSPLVEDSPQIISEVFQEVDGLDVRDVYCKESVCRVSYARTDLGLSGPGSNREVDFLLIDQLSDRLGVDDLDVRYARDESGDEVIYIQLN